MKETIKAYAVTLDGKMVSLHLYFWEAQERKNTWNQGDSKKPFKVAKVTVHS
jgi:hypothetical protein